MGVDRHATDPVRTEESSDRSMAVFERETRSASAARTWLRDFLHRTGIPEVSQADAALVVSELVTNALRHGLGDIVTRASVRGDGDLDVSVTDSGPEQPHLMEPDPRRVGGVGLRVVAQVASEWGVSPFPGGKTVWARIAVVPG